MDWRKHVDASTASQEVSIWLRNVVIKMCDEEQLSRQGGWGPSSHAVQPLIEEYLGHREIEATTGSLLGDCTLPASTGCVPPAIAKYRRPIDATLCAQPIICSACNVRHNAY